MVAPLRIHLMDCHDDLMDCQYGGGGVDGALVGWHSARTSQGTGTRRVWADGSKFIADVGRMVHELDLSSVPSSPVRGAFIF